MDNTSYRAEWRHCKAPCTLSVKLSDIIVTSYRTEKLSKLRSYDRQ